jgi:hypothetical protein
MVDPNMRSHVTRRANWLRYLGLVLAGMVLGIFLLLLLGTYLPGTAIYGPVQSSMSGTVQVVSEDGSAVCIVPDGESEQWCSALYTQGLSGVNVGDHVTVKVMQLISDNGRSSSDLFLIPS